MWYMLLRASDQFATKHKRFPGSELAVGSSAADRAADMQALRSELQDMLTPSDGVDGGAAGCGLDAAAVAAVMEASGPYLDEMCRTSGAEIHPAAALMGGMASQEIIKVITKQFTPVCGGFLMNMMDGSATTINL